MEAFRQIYDGFLSNLYSYGSKLTADSSIVEDSIQEMFLDMYYHRKTLSSTVRLEYYLLKTLRRTIFHRIKRESRFQPIENSESGSFIIDFEIEKNMPEDIQEEKIRMIKDSLAKLDQQHREIIYLKFYARLNYQQISDILGIKPESAKKQVYWVVTKLREDLGSLLLELFMLCFKA